MILTAKEIRNRVDADWNGILDVVKHRIALKAISSQGIAGDHMRRSAEYVASLLQEVGVDARAVQATGADGQPGAWEVIGSLTVDPEAPTVLLYAHHDVQPVPDAGEWDTDPFTGTQVGDRLYGRGASDDKGNAAVAVQTLVSLLGKASVGVIFTADEEIGGMTTATMVKRGYAARRFVLVIDAGAYKVTVAQKGTSYITVRAVGRGGHSSHPWTLDNPIDKLVDAYAKFRAAWPKPTKDHWCDIVSATMLSGGEARNRIPDTAEMTLNLRFVTKDGVERVCKALKDAGLEIVNVVTTGGPVSSDPSAPEIQRLLAAMRAKWPEKKPSIDRMIAATDARHFVDMGVPIAIIGAKGGGAHANVEWIELRCLDEYADLLEQFLGE